MSKVVTYLNDVNRYRNSESYKLKKQRILALKQLDSIVHFCEEADKGIIVPPVKSLDWNDVVVPIIVRFIYCKGEPIQMGMMKKILLEEGVLERYQNVRGLANVLSIMGLLHWKKEVGWKLTLELEDILKERLTKE